MRRWERPGRIAVLLAAGLVLSSCTDESTPTGSSGCLDVDGAYAGTWGDPRCSPPGAARSVAVTQSACTFTAVLPDYALLNGQVDGDRLLVSVTLLASSGACGNAHLSGTGTVTYDAGHPVLRATYGAAGAPPSGCECLPGTAEATLVLRQ